MKLPVSTSFPACVTIYVVPYHHGNLREALIEAGVELAEEGGPEAVVLRAVARRVGVSHNAAYRHFTDHDELRRAVSARAMGEFGALMVERIAAAARGRSKAAAWARMNATGRAYVEFATTRPGLFRIAFQYSMDHAESDQPHPYGQLSARLDELVTVGEVPAARRANAEIAAWSAVHGFSMLVLDGPLRLASEQERDAGLEEVLRVVRYGI
jgi:AcrR family transcriptional regulator